jgi:hypothetical protein
MTRETILIAGSCILVALGLGSLLLADWLARRRP